MLNKHGERTQPCRTPFSTWNHSDSVPATLTIAGCFLYSLASKSINVHHSQPELIMGDRVSWLLEVYKAHIEWLLMLACLAHQMNQRVKYIGQKLFSLKAVSAHSFGWEERPRNGVFRSGCTIHT